MGSDAMMCCLRLRGQGGPQALAAATAMRPAGATTATASATAQEVGAAAGGKRDALEFLRERERETVRRIAPAETCACSRSSCLGVSALERSNFGSGWDIYMGGITESKHDEVGGDRNAVDREAAAMVERSAVDAAHELAAELLVAFAALDILHDRTMIWTLCKSEPLASCGGPLCRGGSTR